MNRDRRTHWVKRNEQERMPPRMVAFDTESCARHEDGVEYQDWKVGCAIRWRTDLSGRDAAEARVFSTPREFWEWVSEFCRAGSRTVVWAHNLGYDVRISQMFTILPSLGFRLEWCNLDRNISSATWRSDHGTIVLADTWTWIPLPLNVVAPQVGMVKYEIPKGSALQSDWARYCMRDAEIVYHVVANLVSFIKTGHLGNWQPTGAGMAYATWRHRHLSHKVLVSDDSDAIDAERNAMHTGRAEAWRHGELTGSRWTEVDLRNAYLMIAAQCDLPRKLHMHHGPMSISQYRDLSGTFAALIRVTVRQEVPVLPARIDGRHLWPVGTFNGWYWDTEINTAIDAGAEIAIHEAYSYCRDPVLRDWAQWVLHVLRDDDPAYSSVVRTHVKHCSRALIGRLALRTPSWEPFGANPDGMTGISYVSFPEEGRVTRMLHVGQDTLIETARAEGRDSLPMITGWIMSECRMRLWRMMTSAGLENLAHVDTDSIVCNSTGLGNLRDSYGDRFLEEFAIKGTWTRLDMWGPRCYYRDGERVMAGIPRKATEMAPGEYAGESWSALASDIEAGHSGLVTIREATWHAQRKDPRRGKAAGVQGETEALRVG